MNDTETTQALSKELSNLKPLELYKCVFKDEFGVQKVYFFRTQDGEIISTESDELASALMEGEPIIPVSVPKEIELGVAMEAIHETLQDLYNSRLGEDE